MKYPVTKIDWNAFQYMFSPDSRTAFQQLTEQLFCFEFHQPYGVYRYYNQPHIETMPIHCGNVCVGFQSKYYDAQTSLSSKKNELMLAISGAHQKYPDINRIVFYINKELFNSFCGVIVTLIKKILTTQNIQNMKQNQKLH